MTWTTAQKLFDIVVNVQECEHPYLQKEVIVHSRKLGWKSRYAYNIDIEHLMVGLQTLVVPSSQVISKIEQYLGEQIEFEPGDTLKNILNKQKKG